MKKIVIISTLFFTVFLLPETVFAGPIGGGGGGCTSFFSCIGNIQNPASAISTEQGLPAAIINLFLPAILSLLGFLAVIFIVISGIQFITSGGNPEGTATAKNRLVFALIGFAIVILAFAITQIVSKIFLGNIGLT